MNYTLVGFYIAAIILYSIAYFKDPADVKAGLENGLKTLVGPQTMILPVIVIAILTGGLVEVMVPRELLAS